MIINPMKSSTLKIRDCFDPLAMTTLGTFYETIKIKLKDKGFYQHIRI